MSQTQLLPDFEAENYIDQEQLHREALKGLIMLCKTPLNPDAKEWNIPSRPRNRYHLRGKEHKRMKLRNYHFEKKVASFLSSEESIERSIRDFLDSKEFKDNIEHQARIMAMHSNEKPKWNILETNMLKGMFALFYQDGRIDDKMNRPLSKYSRNQFIEFLDKYWKPISVVVEEDKCAICYEDMTQETPKTQLLCKHTLCTSCFLQCCRHNGNMLIHNCPLCRARVR